MKTLVRGLLLSAVMCALASANVWAQDSSSPSQEVRPAVTSFWGDTGLWFIPTGEVLKPGGWAFGAYRTELDFKQGSTDVAHSPGRWRLVQALARRSLPRFAWSRPSIAIRVRCSRLRTRRSVAWSTSIRSSERAGRAITSATRMSAPKSTCSEHRRQPMAMALRGTVKLPTAGEDNVGTGQFDYFADVILSKEINRAVELAGFGGLVFRGDPTGVSLSDGFRWGVGAAFGARSSLRFTTELHGEVPTDDVVLSAPGAIVGIDGSISILTQLDSRVNVAAGLTWQHPGGCCLASA